MDVQLRQRGRARIEFLSDLAAWSGRLGLGIDQELADRGLPPSALHADRRQRLQQVDTALASSATYRTWADLSEYLAETHGRVAIEAFEEIYPDLQAQLEELAEQPHSTLELNPELAMPEYFDGVEFHRTEGGWDGHPHQGFIHGEIIHKIYVARNYGGNIFGQRRMVLQELPRQNYQRVFEMGVSSGHFTQALAETFPDAQITGCDLSAVMLRHAQCTANEHGWSWRLLQAPAEATGLPDGSFDLVGSYIVLHELPAEIVRAVFREAYRLLEPGGDMIMVDVRRFQDMSRLEEWRAYYQAVYGGEPYWEESATLDLAEVAAAAGFAEARSYGLGDFHYPWVVVAHKPDGSAR